MIITIDGPTASGKSAIGRMLAQKLNYYYLYSGLLFRALAYELLNQGYTFETINNPDIELVKKLIASMRYEYQNGREQILYNNVDITSHLKQPDIDQGASIMSTNKKVRELIDQWQMNIADDHDVVVEGRDAGTVVFPHAAFKFFLTADPNVRAKRWQQQQLKKGNDIPFDEALAFITKRDVRDSTREHAPLKKAEGAIEIDNSDLSLEGTIKTIITYLA